MSSVNPTPAPVSKIPAPAATSSPSPGAPPPPPPPAPPAPASSVSVSGGHVEPSDELRAKCEAAYQVPTLPSSLPVMDNIPEIDMSLKKQKNNEDNVEKMFMKKKLL